MFDKSILQVENIQEKNGCGPKRIVLNRLTRCYRRLFELLNKSDHAYLPHTPWLYLLKCFRRFSKLDEKGEVIEAKFIKFSKDKVEIKRKDGITFTVSPSTFIKEDQDYLAALRKEDSRGYLWDASSTKFEISSDEWTDAPIGRKALISTLSE